MSVSDIHIAHNPLEVWKEVCVLGEFLHVATGVSKDGTKQGHGAHVFFCKVGQGNHDIGKVAPILTELFHVMHNHTHPPFGLQEEMMYLDGGFSIPR